MPLVQDQFAKTKKKKISPLENPQTNPKLAKQANGWRQPAGADHQSEQPAGADYQANGWR
jgi:hypothetical protein